MISIIVVNWNSGQQLRTCVESVIKFADGLVDKIIVVDNSSIDGSEIGVENLPGVILIRAGVNLGFGKACNFGAKQTGSEYLLFLNHDALLEKHYFFPSSLSGLLFGSSNFGRSGFLPYIPSDVGYVLFIHGAGICGFILSYSFYLLIIVYAYKLKDKNPMLLFLIIYFVFVIFIANLKDFYFISFSGYSQIIFLLICALLISARTNNPYKKTYYLTIDGSS